MPKINLDRTIHAGGKVFFAGEAFVSDKEAVLIDNELERLERLESEAQEADESETPKKKTKTTK